MGQRDDRGVFTNREFQDLTQEEVDDLTDEKAEKLEQSDSVAGMMNRIESEYGPGGEWQEHWITLDNKGTRVFARVYFTDHQSVAVNADGEVVRVEEF